LKNRGNQKEIQMVKEHREQIERTETLTKTNKDYEARIEYLHRVIEEDV
jgi:hypothetical protein